MSANLHARLAKMRRDRRLEWAAFAFHCVGGLLVVLAVVEWVKRT